MHSLLSSYVISCGSSTSEISTNLEDLGADKRIILKWIVNKLDGVTRIGLDQSRRSGGCCEDGCETVGFIKRREFLE